MVWRTGSPRWIPISSIVPMPAHPVAHAVGPLQYQGAPPQVFTSSNRVAAGLFGILLGFFGIHKFVLGFGTAGTVMLLVSLFGSLCYGLGFMVMAVIGIIEGIIYLSKSEAQFHQDYVVNKKQWF